MRGLIRGIVSQGGGGPQPVYLRDNLVDTWNCENQYGNPVGQHAGITLAGRTSMPRVAGKIDDYAFSCEGGYLYSSSSSFVITSAFSFAMWVNFASADINVYQGISSRYNTQNGWRSWRFVKGSTVPNLSFLIYPDGTSTVVTAAGATTLTHSTWYLVGVVYIPSVATQVWLNGQLDGEQTSGIPAALYEGSANYAIGTHYNNNVPSGIISAIIDQPGFWGRALGADDWAELYNSGTGLPYASWNASA